MTTEPQHELDKEYFDLIMQEALENADTFNAKVIEALQKSFRDRTDKDYLYLVASCEVHLEFYDVQGSAWQAWINIGNVLNDLLEKADVTGCWHGYVLKYKYELLDATIGQI